MGVIRLLLALSVLRAHANSILGADLVGGQRAVELFYIISGFYMALILNGKYQGKPLTLFYSNRLLRIFSVYWATLLLMFSLGVLNKLLTGNSSIIGPYVEALGHVPLLALIAFALANIFIIGQQAMLFLAVAQDGHVMIDPSLAHGAAQPSTNFLLLPQAWTLDLELMFYAAAPFLVRRRAWTIAAIAGASAALHLYFYERGYTGTIWDYRFFPFELCLFMLGALCFRVYERLQRIDLPRWPLALAWTAVVLAVLFYPQLLGQDHGAWVLFPLFALALPLIFRLTRNSRLDAAIGELSYPVYLSHAIVLGAIRRFVPGAVLGDAAAVATILLSWGIVKLVADPIERYRARRVARSSADYAMSTSG